MTTFFCLIDNILLSNSEKEDIQLFPCVRITNSEEVKSRILTPKVEEIIGKIEYQHLLKAKTILYFEFKPGQLEGFKTVSDLQILENILIWIDDFLKNLWLYKDNCIRCGTGYFFRTENNQTVANSSMLAYKVSSAENDHLILELSKKELDQIITNHDKIEMYFHQRNSSSLRFHLEKDYSRIARSLVFVKQAREARNIAYKISNYCSAFEALFSTDSNELTYKLSQRVSFFLKDELSAIETFNILKKGYAIRSKLTHGDVLSNTQIKEIVDISKSVDEILRLSLNKILISEDLKKVFDSTKENVDSYFETLIFNGTTPNSGYQL
jgi:hypothetical protein